MILTRINKKTTIFSGDPSYFQRMKSQNNNSFILNPVSTDDGGEYVCTADNGIGDSLVKTIVILVHGNDH